MRVQRTRHPGLTQAISSVGSMTELARRIKVSVQAISQWETVPAERCLMVESVSGVDRRVLRPDIYGDAPVQNAKRRSSARVAA